MDNNVYCALPWMQLMISPSGDYKICCFSGDHTKQSHGFCLDENNKPMNVLTHTMQEALNSESSKSIRKSQLENKRHGECSVCWNKDDDNKISNATLAQSLRVMRTFWQYPKWKIETDPDIVTKQELKIRSLDLRFTNKCNLKCIMCTPMYSTLWYEDYYKMYGNQFGDSSVKYKIFVDSNGKFVSDIPQWYDTEIWKERFDSVKYDLQHLYITGGEPFIVKGHMDILDDLISCDLAKNITLEYDTNLTVINHKILDRLSKFNSVVISVSFDDVGDRYEYFRYPGKFDVLKNNLQFLIANKSDNITIKSLSCCLGILNLQSPWRFREFVETNKIDVPVSYRLLRYPSHFDIKYLPKKQKDLMLNKFQKSDIIDAKESLVVGRLLNNYDIDETECLKKINEHCSYLNKIDSLRGLDWRKTFPETVELLKNYV